LSSHGRSDRAFHAKRAALSNRTRDELRVSQKLADLIVDEWEAEAARRGLAPLDVPYWSEGDRWIADRFITREVVD
jgi:hypothetical protein